MPPALAVAYAIDSSNLTAWAENGVLLLNTCLTVKAGDAGSHSGKGWEEFTDKVVDVVDRYGGANLANSSGAGGRGRGIVFLAWGAWAAKRVAKLDKVSSARGSFQTHPPDSGLSHVAQTPHPDQCGRCSILCAVASSQARRN